MLMRASRVAPLAPSILYAFQTLIGSSNLDRHKPVQSESVGLGHVTFISVRFQRLFSDQFERVYVPIVIILTHLFLDQL